MSLDTVLGIVGVAATVLAGFDARRQRKQREVAVLSAKGTIERTYGLLIGIKPSVSALGILSTKAIDDGLAAINAERDKMKDL